MIIIETIEELDSVKEEIIKEESVWFPIWIDSEKHPKNTQLSFIFVRTSSDYILAINHTDTLSLPLSQIQSLLNTPTKKWVFQKKKLLQSLHTVSPLLDADSSHFLERGEAIDYQPLFQSLISPYYHKGYRDDLIQSIPILKLGEEIQRFIHSAHLSTSNFSFKWYNSLFIPTLARIEELGIRVVGEKFFDSFPHSNPKHITSQNRIYTEYNPFTRTGRPSNRHGGINFAALNKSDGSRGSFVSGEGRVFLQMDYDAFHPRIIGKLINYPLPQTPVHEWLAGEYGVGYDEGKSITFRLLYGGIDTPFKSIPFFLTVDNYITHIWNRVKDLDYLETKYRRIPLSWIEEPNPQKVFNYLLQALETELNIDTIERLRGRGLPLPTLYVYDSFLFELRVGDTQTPKKIKEVVEELGFPVKGSWGMDYGKI